jgi:hypothetical protein
MLGLLVMGAAAAVGIVPAQAAPAATEIQYAIVLDGMPPVAGQAVDFDAVLVSGQAPVPGATLTLTARTFGETKFEPVASALTDAYGRAQVHVRFWRSTVIQWRYAGDGAHDPATAGAFTEQVAPQVSARAVDRTLRTGQRLVIRGRTVPAKPGQRVTLYRGAIPAPLVEQPAPVRLATAYVRADGTYRITRTFSGTGARQLFIGIARGGGNAPGYSNYVHIRVR